MLLPCDNHISLRCGSARRTLIINLLGSFMSSFVGHKKRRGLLNRAGLFYGMMLKRLYLAVRGWRPCALGNHPKFN